MDLYLIRHTRTQAPVGLCYGRLDVPLASSHPTDCAAVAARLPTAPMLRTSPLIRCRALAAKIGARFGIAPEIDERLAELEFGDWEGQYWDSIERHESEGWAADYWNVAPPGGETYRELYERVGAVLAELVAHKVSSVAVVTHAGPIRAALAHCLRLDPARYPEVKLDHGGINLLCTDGAGWRLEYLNG